MDNYKIVAYQKEHGSSMIASGLNDKLMDLDASYEENRIDAAVAGRHTLYYLTISLSLVVAFFLYGMEYAKAGLSQAKEYLMSKLKQQN